MNAPPLSLHITQYPLSTSSISLLSIPPFYSSAGSLIMYEKYFSQELGNLSELSISVAPESVEIRTREPGYSSLHQDAEQDEKESPETISGRAGDELNLECVSVGGNPAPTLYWYIGDKIMPSKQTQENLKSDSGSWKSVSRLNLPVSRDDNLAKVRCEASHDALEANLETSRTLDIMYPPRATASTTATGVLAEGSTVVFSCSAESNPAASISWRRAGGPVLTTESSFTIQSVSRDSAGRYECIAENILGLSKPSSVDIQVQCKYLFFLSSIRVLSEFSLVCKFISLHTSLECFLSK